MLTGAQRLRLLVLPEVQLQAFAELEDQEYRVLDFVPYIGGCQIVVQAVLIVLDWGVHDVVEVLLLLAEAPLQCALVKKLDILKLSVLVSRALSTVHKDLGRYQGYHYLFSVEQGQQEVESVALVVVGGAVEFHAGKESLAFSHLLLGGSFKADFLIEVIRELFDGIQSDRTKRPMSILGLIVS